MLPSDTKIASEYQVQGYPTLKYFVNKSPIEYTGGRTEDTIVFLDIKTQHSFSLSTSLCLRTRGLPQTPQNRSSAFRAKGLYRGICLRAGLQKYRWCDFCPVSRLDCPGYLRGYRTRSGAFQAIRRGKSELLRQIHQLRDQQVHKRQPFALGPSLWR